MPSDSTNSTPPTIACESFALRLAELADARDVPDLERFMNLVEPHDPGRSTHQVAVDSRGGPDAGVGQEAGGAEIVVNSNSMAVRHLSGCLRCQAELAQYRRILRGLASLVEVTESPDDELLEEILVGLRPPAQVLRLPRLSSNRRAAYLGGIAAAATGVTAGALVLVSRLTSKQGLAS